MTNSRRKGKDAENELARLLRRLLPGCAARRGQQYHGLEGQDLVTAVAGLHLECKRREQLNVGAAVAQARSDAADGAVPVVCHRRSRTAWLLTVELERLPELIRLLYPFTAPENSADGQNQDD